MVLTGERQGKLYNFCYISNLPPQQEKEQKIKPKKQRIWKEKKIKAKKYKY